MREAEVVLEVPAGWFDNPNDGARHQRLYASILTALSRLSVRILPVELPFGADTAKRLYRHDQLVISYHSQGPRGNIVRLKESYIPPYYTFDTEGFSGFSALSRHPDAFLSEIEAYPLEAAREFVLDLSTRIQSHNISKYAQPDHLDDVPEGGFVFFPLQTEDDPVATLAYLDQIDVAQRLATDLQAAGRGLIIKRHPFCTSARVGPALAELEAEHPNVMIATGSIHGLITRAYCVVGCNSGVLFEALVHGAHVVSFGASDFQMATTSVANLSMLLPAVLGPPVDADARVRFLAWYLRRYCFEASDAIEVEARLAEMLDQMDVVPITETDAQKELFYQAAVAEAARRKGFRDPS